MLKELKVIHFYFITFYVLILSLSIQGIQEARAKEITQLNKDRSVFKNKYGAVILDGFGTKINYSKEQLDELATQVQSNLPEKGKMPETPISDFNITWTYAPFGSCIGMSNIIWADNEGQIEIYLGGSCSTFGANNYWHTLIYNPSTNDYKQIYVSPFYSTSISRMDIGDILGDSNLEILVAQSNGKIQVYDQKTKEWILEISSSASSLKGMDIVDLDSDGKDEIVLCTSSNLYVYEGNGTLKWSLTGVGGADVKVANMDSDASLEIAVGGGYVVDADTHTIQWDHSGAFGVILESADIDDDMKEELIAAEAWYIVWAYNVDTQTIKWSIPVDLDVNAINVDDIDNDGTYELLIGDGQWGHIHAYDTKTQTKEWSINNPEHGVTDIAVVDADNDGVKELLWGAGATSTGEDHLYITDWQTKNVEWQNVHLDGPFIGPEIGDLDGDEIKEIVIVSWESDSGYGSGRILVFDGATMDLIAMSGEIVNGNAWTGTHDLKLRDVDNDSQLEILIAADRLYDGVIEIYDFNGHDFSLIWTNSTRPEGAPFYSVDAADIDKDGDLEIIGGGGREHTGATGVYVYIYDYATAVEEWHSFQIGGYWDNISGLKMEDLDYDLSLEIIAMVDGGDVYIIDGVSKEHEKTITGSFSYVEVYNATVEDDCGKYLLLGDETGNVSIYQYVGGTYSLKSQQNFVSGSIDGFTIYRFDPLKIWIGSGGILKFFDSSVILLQSPNYGTLFGSRVRYNQHTGDYLSSGQYSLNAFYDVQDRLDVKIPWLEFN